jgi:hypothetical protein
MLVLWQKGHLKKYCWQTKKSEEKSKKEANLSLTNSGFISYQSIDEVVVFMGNGTPSKIVGVGSIRIMMFGDIVRELADVRYVVEIKSNLISLGLLESCGYKYTCQGGALTLWKSSLVLMKATKVDNLYKLEGDTKVAYEVTDLSSCLWQKHQGHKSKK